MKKHEILCPAYTTAASLELGLSPGMCNCGADAAEAKEDDNPWMSPPPEPEPEPQEAPEPPPEPQATPPPADDTPRVQLAEIKAWAATVAGSLGGINGHGQKRQVKGRDSIGDTYYYRFTNGPSDKPRSRRYSAQWLLVEIGAWPQWTYVTDSRGKPKTNMSEPPVGFPGYVPPKPGGEMKITGGDAKLNRPAGAVEFASPGGSVKSPSSNSLSGSEIMLKNSDKVTKEEVPAGSRPRCSFCGEEITNKKAVVLRTEGITLHGHLGCWINVEPEEVETNPEPTPEPEEAAPAAVFSHPTEDLVDDMLEDRASVAPTVTVTTASATTETTGSSTNLTKTPGTYGGIDCGRKGYQTLIGEDGEIIEMTPAPVFEIKGGAEYDLDKALEIVRRWKELGVRRVMVEKLWGISKIGGKVMGAKPNFQKGFAFAMWRTALVAVGVPHDVIAPISWKKAMRVWPDPEKKKAMAKAQSIFPGVDIKETERNPGKEKPDGDKAESMILAEYVRMVCIGGMGEDGKPKEGAWAGRVRTVMEDGGEEGSIARPAAKKKATKKKSKKVRGKPPERTPKPQARKRAPAKKKTVKKTPAKKKAPVKKKAPAKKTAKKKVAKKKARRKR